MANVTLESFTIPNSHGYSGTITLRFYYTGCTGLTFLNSDNDPVACSAPGSGAFFYEATVSLSGNDLTIPNVPLVSTDDATPGTIRLTAIFFVNGRRRDTLFSDYVLTNTLGATINFGQLTNFQPAQVSLPLPSTYLTAAQIAGLVSSSTIHALSNVRLAKTTTYTLENADRGKTVALGGSAYFTLSADAASGFDTDFQVLITNEDTVRAKKVEIDGLDTFLLYPGQTAWLYVQNSAWRVFRNNRWLVPASMTVYVDSTLGNDNNDGMAAGAGAALATIQAAINQIKRDFDLTGPRTTPVVIQLADGTYSGGANPVAMASGPFTGQQPATYTFPSTNEVPVSIRGNTGTPANVLLTSSGVLGTVLTVWGGVLGVQDCEVENTGAGACLESGGQAGIQFGNVILGACGAAKVQSEHNSIMENYSNFTVKGNCTNVFRSQYHSSIWLTGTITIGASFSVTHFAIAKENSEISCVSATIALGGNTVTGTRFAVTSSSSINGVVSNITFFPGTLPGTIDNGTYDGIRSVLGTVDWPSWTPTVDASSGSILSASAVGAYWADGKTIHFRISVTISNNGTGAGYVRATLPFSSKPRDFQFMARRVDTGDFIAATIVGSSVADVTHIYFATLTNTYPGANGAVLVATGTYETA